MNDLDEMNPLAQTLLKIIEINFRIMILLNSRNDKKTYEK